MVKFAKKLGQLLEGHTFSYQTMNRASHTDLTLLRPVEIVETQEGRWTVQLGMRGGLVCSISTCYEAPEGRLTITQGEPGRVWFAFTAKSLRLLTKIPGYEFQTLFTI